jgi:NADPH:quinone reductase-like Zn-dependent oxidoreductase
MCIQFRVLGEKLEGAYAKYVKLPAENCFPVPSGLLFKEAAAFPLHRKEDFARAVNKLTENRGVDVVLDCVAGEVWQKSLAALARAGRLVTCRATAGGQPHDDLTAISSKHLKIYGSTLGSREEFRQLLSFMSRSRIKPIVDRVFPLKEAAAAQRHLEEAKQFGKVVLRI